VFITNQKASYTHLYSLDETIIINLEKNYYVEEIYIHSEKRYIVNLTDHEKLLGLDKEIPLWPQPIAQARISDDKKEIYYYTPYGNYKKDIIFIIEDTLIHKNDPTVIKIVSEPTVEYWANTLKCKIKDVIYRYGWVYPTFTRENPYYLKIL